MVDAFQIALPPGGAKAPLIVHIPHSSSRASFPWRDQIVLSDEALDRELLAMTDRYTDELFSQLPATEGVIFINRLSRLVFDPERFEDQRVETMDSVGMGAVYVRTSDGHRLRAESFSPRDHEEILAQLFRPYARALSKSVAALLDEFDRCLLLDCHSFPMAPLPYEDKSLDRPDICLGYEPFHAPGELVGEIEDLLAASGLRVGHNTPFAGSYVPLPWYRRDARVSSLMIELNRSLYMEEHTGARSSGFDRTADLTRRILELAAR
jgi:N-formylglutamate amidohydrolase